MTNSIVQHAATALDALRVVSGVLAELLASEDPKSLLDALFSRLSNQLGAEFYFNYLLRGDRFELHASSGISPEMFQRLQVLHPFEGVCGTVLQTRQSAIFENVSANAEPLTELIRSLGITAYACFPLMAKGQPLGTLSFGTRHRERFGEQELTLMQVVADGVAVAVQRQEWRIRTEETVRQHQVVEEKLALLAQAASNLIASPGSADILSGILDLSKGLIEADAYAVWQRDPGADMWRIVASANLSPGFVAAQHLRGDPSYEQLLKSPIIIEDTDRDDRVAFRREQYRSEHIRGMLVLPLMARQNYGGTLVLYYRRPRKFDDFELRIANALSSLAATAIDNAISYRAQSSLRAAAQESEHRHRFLAEASQTLSSSLDYEATLKTVAQLAVPHFADWVTIDLADDDGSIRRVAVAHADPEKVKWAWTIGNKYPPDPASDRGVPGILKRGKAELHTHITDEMLVAAAQDAEHLQAIRELGLNDVIMAPLSARNRTYGVITFIAAKSERRFTPADLALLEDLASRAGLAIDNARLYHDAQTANRAKDDFMAILSHELRTPLTPVLALLSSYKDDHAVPDSLRDDLRAIQRNVELEARLIDDLLDVTRIARGKMQLHMEVVDANVVIAEVYEMCRAEAEQKGVRCSMHLDAPHHFLCADPARLRQMLWNLLKNSIKFTPAGGSVSVTSRNEPPASPTEPPRLVLQVVDTGIGIAPDLIPTIFDAFVQGKVNDSRLAAGLGLGLAITRSLAESHGGSITAASTGPGAGATFTLTLPTVAAAPDSSRSFPPPSTERMPSIRILLVEDHPDTAMVMARLLRSLSHQVATAASVHEALTLVESRPFDLLLSDVGLPDGSGIDLLRRARFLSPTPAIALTGYGMDEDIRRCLDAGFAAHLTKPITVDLLEKTMAEVIQRQRTNEL